MNKVLMPIGDASETVDTLYPHLRLQEEGFEPVVAAPETGKIEALVTEADGFSVAKGLVDEVAMADAVFVFGVF